MVRPLKFDNGGLITNELPDFRNATFLYADFETKSGNKSEKSTNPHRFCDVLGIAVTVDNCPNAYYIPIGHATDNIERERAVTWWRDVLTSAKYWVNHNVKYDAWVSLLHMGVKPELPLICTVVLSKLVDSDRRHYSLDAVAKDWLHEDISKYEDAFKPYLFRNKDYGAIPYDIMGEYACQDVLTNRRLYKWLMAQMPQEVVPTMEMEQKLTGILFNIEQRGMRVNPQKLKLKEMLSMARMLEIDEYVKEKTGTEYRLHTNEDCYDLLCNHYGLPVLGETDSGEPSFDKEALVNYLTHPRSDTDLIQHIMEYRKLNTFTNLFLTKYQKLEQEGLLYPSYNQLVRTGRMSSKDPNSQQLSELAKELIEPNNEGDVLLSFDYSQIEFRLIVHYIRDPSAIAAYAENPDTDFHDWVAKECGIQRKPAKTVNFLIAFGGGKEKLLKALASNIDLVGSIKDQCQGDEELFTMLSYAKANSVYNTYHARLPGLKITSRRAARVARERGYIKNLFKRRRHLPADRCHIAFNTLNQSSAADLIKHKMVELADIPYCIAQVHDELLFSVPKNEALEVARHVRAVLESPPVPLLVPLRTSCSISERNWGSLEKFDIS